MFTAMLWIIYNFIVGAYVSVIGSVIELIASLLGLIKQKKYYKKA